MNRLPKFQHHAPATAADAASLLAEYKDEAMLIAGGTDLLISMKQRLHTPRHLIDLSSIAGLEFMEYDDAAGLRVGAAITLASLADAPLVKEKYPALAAAAQSVASVQVRNVATIGGNLCLDTRCWYYNQSHAWRQSRPPCLKTGGEVCHVVGGSKRCFAVYSGDMAPILMALGAEVKLLNGDGERAVPLRELFSGDSLRPHTIKSGEFLSEISVPPPAPGSEAAYIKLRLREEVDFPILSVAAAVTMSNGACRSASLVLSAVGPAPLEVVDANRLLQGKEIAKAALEETAQAAYTIAHPVANTAGTPQYRRRMVPVLVKQALAQAIEAARS